MLFHLKINLGKQNVGLICGIVIMEVWLGKSNIAQFSGEFKLSVSNNIAFFKGPQLHSGISLCVWYLP